MVPERIIFGLYSRESLDERIPVGGGRLWSVIPITESRQFERVSCLPLLEVVEHKSNYKLISSIESRSKKSLNMIKSSWP